MGSSASQSLQTYQNSCTFPTPRIALNHDPIASTVNTLAPQAIDLLKGRGYTLNTVAGCLGASDLYKESVAPSARDSTWVC